MVHSINQLSQMLNVIQVQSYPDAGINCDYEHDKFPQNHGEVVSCFRHLTKDTTLPTYITPEFFKTANNYPAPDKPGYFLFVFDIRSHQEFATSQTKSIWISNHLF